MMSVSQIDESTSSSRMKGSLHLEINIANTQKNCPLKMGHNRGKNGMHERVKKNPEDDQDSKAVYKVL